MLATMFQTHPSRFVQWSVVALALFLVPLLPQTVQGHGEEEELREILNGLEQGMNALRRLGAEDALEHLERVAERVGKKLEKQQNKDRHREGGNRRERATAENQIELLHLAYRVLRESGREDAAEYMEQILHAQKLALEGRKDDEAMEIRHSAPNLGNRIELVRLAQRLLEEAGHERNALAMERLADQWLERYRHQQQKKKQKQNKNKKQKANKKQRAGNSEREVARKQLEIMRVAFRALQEAERRDDAAEMEHAIHAAELNLEGRRDEEAQHVRKTAPDRGAVIELLLLAQDFYQEWGHEDRAHMVGGLAKKMGNRGKKQRKEAGERRQRREQRPDRDNRDGERRVKREHRSEREHPERVIERIERLEGAIERLQNAIRSLHRAVEESASRGGTKF